MMSVPAINSVLPPSGSQPAKINSSPTANPTPIGLSVPPKLSVIPPPQIPTSPSKPPLGVNHSQVPLSLVYENKVTGSQGQSSFPKAPSEKPKDLSPAKSTLNGVEASSPKTSPHTQQPQSSSTNKAEDTVQPTSTSTTTSNHTEERIPLTTESAPGSEEPAQNSNSEPQNEKVAEPVEPSSNQNNSKEEKASEETGGIEKSETKGSSEETTGATTTEGKSDVKSEEKNSSPPQPSKRKREQKPQEKKEDEPEPEKKSRRIRSQVLPYQSPLPELATFINKSLKEKDASQKNNEEKLIVFYRNEFLAVRNAEGGFYLCQTLQNVYRSSHRIRIRWLSQNKEQSTDDGDIYAPDFYDLTDFECILTTVALSKRDKNMYKLPKVELERIENILKRALDVEKGVTEKPSITEEHPDGIDLSLYKDESQLQKPKKNAKRKASSSPAGKSPKQTRKNESGDAGTKTQPTKKTTTSRSRRKTARKAAKTTAKGGKRTGGRSDASKSKAVDQLKVSPPNEKARVVAKVLRKVDIVPAKEVSTKKQQPKSKTAKRSQDVSKTQKKKPLRSGGKPGAIGKDEPSGSHHERRSAKNKYSSNNKNKK